MEVLYKPSFIRAFQKLDLELKNEVDDKVREFKNPKNHKKLKVHALKGELKGFYSFSVNYRYRIVFTFAKSKKEAHLHAVGDHTVYR